MICACKYKHGILHGVDGMSAYRSMVAILLLLDSLLVVCNLFQMPLENPRHGTYQEMLTIHQALMSAGVNPFFLFRRSFLRLPHLAHALPAGEELDQDLKVRGSGFTASQRCSIHMCHGDSSLLIHWQHQRSSLKIVHQPTTSKQKTLISQDW